MRVLFITWDAPELTYLQSLFLPIFSELRRSGVTVDILQFRWGDQALTQQVKRTCEEAGSGYRAVKILRGLGSAGAVASATAGAVAIHRAAKHFGSDALMPRGFMPSVMTLAANLFRLPPIIFDSDGLPADERVDFAGMSPQSATYRVLRAAEARIVRASASVLVRSERGRDILLERANAGINAPKVTRDRFCVVTNGRDERLFAPGDTATRSAVRQELGVDGASPLLVYAGSVGPQYRFEAMGALMTEVQRLRADARLLVMSGSPDRARAALAASHPRIAAQATVIAVPPAAVPRYLAAADLGIAYRRTSFSTQAVAPIKLAEYLLCGLPVVGTAAIGDTRPALEAGVFLDEAEGAEAAAAWLVKTIVSDRGSMRNRAREVGIANFSLARSANDYLHALGQGLAKAADEVRSRVHRP